MLRTISPARDVSKDSVSIRECFVRDLGLIEYSKAYFLQKQCVQEVLQGHEHYLLFCEHFPVVTLGRMSHQENFLLSPELIKQRGVAICHVDRGGDLTLHAPGQLVIYPILNLNDLGRDLKVYLERLQQTAVELLKDLDISARGISEKRGVWVGADKIASIGIGVRKWVSFHGMSINVCNDLSLYSMIRPCGLDVAMTSIEKVKQAKYSVEEIKNQFLIRFQEIFNLKIIKE